MVLAMRLVRVAGRHNVPSTIQLRDGDLASCDSWHVRFFYLAGRRSTPALSNHSAFQWSTARVRAVER